MKDMKDKVLEIADIAKACPENLQAICFETLLKNFLAGIASPPSKQKKEDKTSADNATIEKEPKASNETETAKQEDIRDADVHVKAKRFMQKEGVSLEQINNLFYREDDKILPLFDDLKTTRMAENQIRIALLQCLVRALITGDFDADIEVVRAECVKRKCYDRPNFSTIFKKNAALFDFDKFDRTTKSVRLSETGKKELGDVVKELQ